MYALFGINAVTIESMVPFWNPSRFKMSWNFTIQHILWPFALSLTAKALEISPRKRYRTSLIHFFFLYLHLCCASYGYGISQKGGFYLLVDLTRRESVTNRANLSSFTRAETYVCFFVFLCFFLTLIWVHCPGGLTLQWSWAHVLASRECGGEGG